MTERKHPEFPNRKVWGQAAEPASSGYKDDTGLSEEDAETIRLLRDGLDCLESLAPVFEPAPHWFEAQIEEHAARIRKRFVRDLAIFLSVAVVVLFGLAAAILKVPAAFIVLQAAALLAAPLVALRLYRKRVKSHDPG
jgi:hypothetical protein